MAATKVGHALAKFLRIKLEYRDPLGRQDVTRGESAFSLSSADPYVEEEPSTVEVIKEFVPTPRAIGHYVYHLFPFIHWIGRYNLQWFAGDLVAGITVGCVVVPQGMAYALLASLPPEFGLYSSFMGLLVYWPFATSKDITIGPVAVMSTLVGNIVIKIQKTDPDLPGFVVASALSVIAGSIILALGFARFGRIVDFISLPAISAFMTGSAINIATGQVPALLGITTVKTRESTYKVIINILKHLGDSKIDAAMGLSALVMLYIIRYACVHAAKRLPGQRRLLFFVSTLRTVFVILLYTMISWLVNRNRRKKPLFKILGTVPRGFKHAVVPTINTRIVKLFLSELPATVIVLLIEHIAISKSFGRINNYTIDPSQEMVAIGITNVLGPFLGAYPATGSFSRTAIKSKAGVRTPFGGPISAVVVLLAIYALTAVFFYIPSSGLSAVIIHAVGDLITPPNTVYQFWQVSPLEVFIFFAGVFVTVFTNIENGIYTTICVSVAMLLVRFLTAQGRFLGRVKVHSVVGDHHPHAKDSGAGKRPDALSPEHATVNTRDLFLPIDHKDGSNPEIHVDSPSPGIFIYRFSEGFNFPNANHYLDYLTKTVFAHTRRTDPFAYGRPGVGEPERMLSSHADPHFVQDRPWNDPGPRKGHEEDHTDRPTLKAVILDFSSVNHIDITSVQLLIDIRNQLDRWAAPDHVEWHIACLTNRWTKRALVNAGFGYPTPGSPHFARWKPIFSVADAGGSDSAATVAEHRDNEKIQRRRSEAQRSGSATSADKVSEDFSKDITKSNAYAKGGRVTVVQGLNRPCFHIDLTSALQSAIQNVELKDEATVIDGKDLIDEP
ncbi:MAG: Sulfate permease 2 [Thelocarpon impressellum]|nr:MAG: Sulfate permease 2 [Thelocarpon impressellum]